MDPNTPILRPHQRRALAAHLQVTEDDVFGKITPPSLDTVEALEAAFPVTLPEETSNAILVVSEVQRQLGQQDVIRFLKNLIETARGN